MSEYLQNKPTKPSHMLRRIGIYSAVLLFVFLLGFIPMWQKAIESGVNLASVQRELTLTQMQNTLASAAIYARRGEYETARQAASDFFILLGTEVEKEADSALTLSQIENTKPLFNERDELITLLARNDPASADRLSDLYVLYRKILNG